MIDLRKAVEVLTDSGVEFVLIGGAAMTAHGSAYVTQDLDICYQRSYENIRRLVDALLPYHPRLRGTPTGIPFQFDAETIERGLNFTFATDLGDLDLLGEVTGLGFYNHVQECSVAMPVYGRECQVLSLEGLL